MKERINYTFWDLVQGSLKWCFEDGSPLLFTVRIFSFSFSFLSLSMIMLSERPELVELMISRFSHARPNFLFSLIL